MYKRKISNTYKNAKKQVFGSGGITGRYGIGQGKGGLNITNIAKDLAYVKSRLNVEKKFHNQALATAPFGQSNVNVDGWYAYDITPSIAQGTGESNRIGGSLKLTGLSIPLAFKGQTNCLNERRIKVSLLQVLCSDVGVTPAETINTVWDPSANVGIRDYYSPKGYRNSATDGISIIKEMTCVLPAVQAGGTGSLSEGQVGRVLMNFTVKMQNILRFEGASSTPAGCRYYLVFFADAGNVSTTAATTTALGSKGASTGCVIDGHYRYWYVDN